MDAPDLALSRATEAVEGAEPVGELRLGDMVRSLAQAALRSSGHVPRAASLGREAARVAVGRSEVAPEKGDSRFRDPAWQEHFAYRRAMQLYLAWSQSVESMVEAADLEWRDSERARFFAAILTTAVAPTNTLIGNPAAIKRAFETGGASVVRGARNLVRDVRHNGGMPLQVDSRAFTLGENLAATPGGVVYRDEVCEVIQYTPSTPEIRSRPVLVIPPQINKYYFLDLAPKRSLVEYLVSRGLAVFMISWRNPGPAEAEWDMDTYAAAVLRALDVAREVSRSDDVNALSFCAGGILTASVLSHLAAQSDESINTASFGVTLLDFATPNTIGLFDTSPLIHMGRVRSSRAGVLDGHSLANVFTWLRPNDLVWNYWVNNNLLGNDPPTFDILAWNADPTNLPARAPQPDARHLHREPHCRPRHRGAGDAGRRRPGRDGDVRHWCADRSPHAMEGVLQDDSVDQRSEHLHPQQRRAHREPRQPSGQPEGPFLRGPGARSRPRRLARGGDTATWDLVGALERLGRRALRKQPQGTRATGESSP